MDQSSHQLPRTPYPLFFQTIVDGQEVKSALFIARALYAETKMEAVEPGALLGIQHIAEEVFNLWEDETK